MLVHLGDDIMVDDQEVVAIIAYEAMEASSPNLTFLDWAADRREVTGVSGSRVRSAVICRDRVFLSPISPTTLMRRATRVVSR